MANDLQHEDLLLKLRAKLNEEKIKLWEPPYIEKGESQSLQDLAKKYSIALSVDQDIVLQALHELQLHSLDRSKANAEFKETGCATFRVKATLPGGNPQLLKIQNKLSVTGTELIRAVAAEIGVTETRVKLIFSGKVIQSTPTLEEQGVRNGAQIMAVIMAETPEEIKKEDTRYMEMKATRDDATLLLDCADDLADDEEYMMLENQSGAAVELPAAERRDLMLALALHERGRAAATAPAPARDLALALVLFLEADRHFNECSSSILKSVDNWAILQLDISWCYLCLQNLSSASDAAVRLQRAEAAFIESYGENHERLIATKGNAANERVLFMRLYLLQGIVAYHQNRRAEAKWLLDKAEVELNSLRVDESSVLTLMELGWARGAARGALRAARGSVPRAQRRLEDERERRRRERDQHRLDRQQRLLGTCMDGTAVSKQLVEALIGMGYTRRLAAAALRHSNNNVADALLIIQERRELLDSDLSSDETDAPSSAESLVVPDDKLLEELQAMGYTLEQSKNALSTSNNHISGAVDLLLAGACEDNAGEAAGSNPSTSAGTAAKKKLVKQERDTKRRARDLALQRLRAALGGGGEEEEEHLDTALVEEEEFLAQYKSLL